VKNHRGYVKHLEIKVTMHFLVIFKNVDLNLRGGVQAWHIQADVLPLLDGHCNFQTMDGTNHRIDGKWDMILAFPPCTHLAVSGARHFEKKYEDGRQLQGLWFFCQFFNADCDKVCIENPINIISGDYVTKKFRYHCLKYGLPVKPTQIIQPYYFGDPARKKTQLWLKGLPKLKPTNMVEPELVYYKLKSGRITSFSENYCKDFKGMERGKARSTTFQGVADAMAEQWG